jgi:hypothetical protein
MRTTTAAGLFLALTLLLTWPLPLHPASAAMPMGPDGDLFAWTLAWDAHAFVHQPLAIFDANIYHPLRHTLAFSENLIGSALIAAPIIWATGNPVLALNVVALLSVMLCGLGVFVLARRLGLGPAAAVVAGVIFAFSPPRFFRTSQLHLGVVQWMPFALASLHAYLDEGRRRDLRLAAAFFTLEALSSGHGAVFLVIAMGGLLAWSVAAGAPIAPLRRARDLGLAGALLLAPSVLVYLPYRAVQQEMGLRRTLENWAVTPESFIAAPTHLQTALLSLLPGPRVLDTASAFLFPGFLPLLLAAAAASIILARRPPSESRPRWVAFYGVLCLLSLWLSIGPPFGLWPLVYWLPGMSFIRVPSRFTILAMLGLAVVAAAGVEWLAARLAPARRRAFAAVVTLLLVAEFAAVPLAVAPFRVDPPLADRWLAGRPGPFAVAEVPLPDPRHPGAFERRQTLYMLHATAHWQKTVHGYSGIRAPLHDRLYALLRAFPDEACLDELDRLGVRYVVVHTELYPPGEWEQAAARIDGHAVRLRLEHVAGTGRVYSLHGPTPQ